MEGGDFKIDDLFLKEYTATTQLIVVLAIIAVLLLIYYVAMREKMANPSNPRTMTEAEWSKVAMGH